MNFCNSVCANLFQKKAAILAANKKDCRKAKKLNYSDSFLRRLQLDEKKIDEMVKRIKAVKEMKIGLGEAIEEKTLDNGVLLKKVRVPIGRILFIYESRPEVTIDIAVLSIYSGNKAILKGGNEAKETNKILMTCVEKALLAAHLPSDAVEYVESSRQKLYSMLKKNTFIDLVVARGGYPMVQNILNRSTIPVLSHSEGGARIYIDGSANLAMAQKIVLNAKTSNPAACNSLDTLLIHKDIAPKFLPSLVQQLKRRKVTIVPSAKKNWEKEFLSLTLAIKLVESASSALEFISAYTNHHSEGIIARDKKVIAAFVKSIDAAALFINCSPRLHDGFIFGLGAEAGIATGKLHVRGPVGLSDLTTYTWVMEGNGQIRE